MVSVRVAGQHQACLHRVTDWQKVSPKVQQELFAGQQRVCAHRVTDRKKVSPKAKQELFVGQQRICAHRLTGWKKVSPKAKQELAERMTDWQKASWNFLRLRFGSHWLMV